MPDDTSLPSTPTTTQTTSPKIDISNPVTLPTSSVASTTEPGKASGLEPRNIEPSGPPPRDLPSVGPWPPGNKPKDVKDVTSNVSPTSKPSVQPSPSTPSPEPPSQSPSTPPSPSPKSIPED